MSDKQNWEAVVYELIKETYADQQFTRKDLISDCMDKIVKATGSIGATPNQTLSRILQVIRDRGYLTFCRPGRYQLTPQGLATKYLGTPSRSRGEKMVAEILTELNIEFKEQVRVNINPVNLKAYYLIFDFRFRHNNTEYAVEFDGAQHLRPVDWFGGESAFKRQVIRDKRKDRYCKAKNITMIRVFDAKYDICKNTIEYYLQTAPLQLLF
ncbi:hypothetical protein D5b_00283 [Faustovirus]|nr:hypothetical protein D5b_00283 [Faustovirus]AMN84629.1 hypothetical protein D6_00226 [Faustovirus]